MGGEETTETQGVNDYVGNVGYDLYDGNVGWGLRSNYEARAIKAPL